MYNYRLLFKPSSHLAVVFAAPPTTKKVKSNQINQIKYLFSSAAIVDISQWLRFIY
jgi:hypothetical protein